MKIKRRVLIIFVSLFIIGITAFIGCNSATQRSTLPSTSTTVSATPTQNKEPVEVISIIGPIPPFNPGGPVIEITLKNISNTSIVSLSAALGINSNLNRPYEFAFNVSAGNPVLPGNSITSRETLIGAGFGDNVAYPLEISGSLGSGEKFDFTKQVMIEGPSSTSTITVKTGGASAAIAR